MLLDGSKGPSTGAAEGGEAQSQVLLGVVSSPDHPGRGLEPCLGRLETKLLVHSGKGKCLLLSRPQFPHVSPSLPGGQATPKTPGSTGEGN